jgi:hypothetical protein
MSEGQQRARRQPVEARELHALDDASRRVLDREPVRSDARGGLEGELVLRTGGSPPAPSIREPDATPRALPADADVELREDASVGAQQTWREVWEGRL